MTAKITILGCGYLGKELARLSLSRGWLVSAFTRNPSTAEELRESGVSQVVTGRLEERDWHAKLDPDQDYLVDCVGAASPGVDGYRKSYLEGLLSIRDWLHGGFKGAFVFTSSTSVYPQTQGEVVDEESENEGVGERGRILLDAERECLSLNSDERRSFVLRLAGLYGPGRHLLIDKVRNGVPMSGNGNRILNLIHRNDAALAIVSVLEASGRMQERIYNVCDNEGASRREIVGWIAGELGLPAPSFEENDGEGVPNRKVSSKRLGDEINWRPSYPSFRAAYQEMLAS